MLSARSRFDAMRGEGGPCRAVLDGASGFLVRRGAGAHRRHAFAGACGRGTAIIGGVLNGVSVGLQVMSRLCDSLVDFWWQGRVTVGDLPVDQEDSKAVRREIGMLDDHLYLFPEMPRDSLVFGLRIRGCRDEIRVRSYVEEVLKRRGLWDGLRLRLLALAAGLRPEKVAVALPGTDPRRGAVNPRIGRSGGAYRSNRSAQNSRPSSVSYVTR